jgi:hypothetical protein
MGNSHVSPMGPPLGPYVVDPFFLASFKKSRGPLTNRTSPTTTGCCSLRSDIYLSKTTVLAYSSRAVLLSDGSALVYDIPIDDSNINKFIATLPLTEKNILELRPLPWKEKPSRIPRPKKVFKKPLTSSEIILRATFAKTKLETVILSETVPLDQVIFKERMSKHSFCAVWLCKRFFLKSLNTVEATRAAVGSLAVVPHRNVVLQVGTTSPPWPPSSSYLVSEWMNQGTLSDWLFKPLDNMPSNVPLLAPPLATKLSLTIVREICAACIFLENVNFSAYTVSPKTIALSLTGTGNLKVKLRLDCFNTSVHRGDQFPWQSPEGGRGDPVFSLGAVLWSLFTNLVPWAPLPRSREHQLAVVVSTGKALPDLLHCPFSKVIKSCTNLNKEDRIDLEELLAILDYFSDCGSTSAAEQGLEAFLLGN